MWTDFRVRVSGQKQDSSNYQSTTEEEHVTQKSCDRVAEIKSMTLGHIQEAFCSNRRNRKNKYSNGKSAIVVDRSCTKA